MSEPLIAPVAYQPPQAPPPTPGFRLHPAMVAVALVVLGFLLAMSFLFTARAVSIEVTPSPDQLKVDGGFVLRWGDRYLMPTGRYRVRAEKARYHPLEEALTVTGDATQTHAYQLRLLPGRLVVRTTPSPAQITVDDESVGQTPLAPMALPAGQYRLRVSAPRHEPSEQIVEMVGGGDEQLIEVSLTPAWAAVTVTSIPAGADIVVDGEALGTTPATVEIGAGTSQMALTLPGYQRWQQTLTVVSDVPQTLETITLKPADGQLSLTSDPSGASVSVGGRFRGTTPTTLSLAPEQAHSVSVRLDGHRSADQSVRLAADERRQLAVTLAPILGVLQLSMTPADAELRINGVPRPLGDGRLSLTATRHQLEVRKPGHQTVTREVSIRPDVEQRLEIRLLTDAEARLAATPAQIIAKSGQTLRRIQPGRFVMGTPRNDQGRQANEVQRPVHLTRMFYLATTEVTNAQFRTFSPQHVSGISGRQTLDNERQPVVRVSWLQAVRYCNWLSEQEGLPKAYTDDGELITPVGTGYRLPSEAEWEWAARHAGLSTPLRYPWGAAMPPPPNSGNFADASAAPLVNQVLDGYQDGFPASAPVASFAVDRLGLYDMGGNVAEWVHDRYDGLLVIGGAEVADPFGPAAGGDRVIRGSSWKHGRMTELRLAYRDFGREPREDLGFRIARYAE